MQPENLAYMDTLGWIFFQKEDFKKSFEIFNHIINILDRESKIEGEDDLDEIYYHIGMIYEKMGRKEEAMGYYSIGLKINPSNNLIKQRMK
jgi:tetratricopeptide (TPR) repeat protein